MSEPNYFAGTATAERYARARPYLHPHVVRQIGAIVGAVDLALDVACGTGMSSLALVEAAQRIIGVDASGAMLAHAAPHPRIAYVAGRGEALPVASRSMTLVTVGLAYHWLDRQRFLAEAQRVTCDAGWLAIYNTWFAGQMDNNPAFAEWWTQHYLARYPALARRSEAIVGDEVSAHGFDLVEHSTLERPVRFSVSDLLAYLSTQSSVLAVANRAGSLERELEWLRESLHDHVRNEGVFSFSGELWVFRRRLSRLKPSAAISR